MATRLPMLGCLARNLSRQPKWRRTIYPCMGVNHFHASHELLGFPITSFFGLFGRSKMSNPDLKSLNRESVGVDPTVLHMPAYSAQMVKGGIVEWLKKEGDPVQPGDVLCRIKTDKSNIDHEVDEEGILAKILIPEDTDDIAIGTPIALMVEEGEDWRDVNMPKGAIVTPPAASAPPSGHTSIASSAMGPAAKFLLEQYDLQPTALAATGPRGILIKGDILQFVKQKNLKPVPPSQIDLPPRLQPSVKAAPAPAKVPAATAAAAVVSPTPTPKPQPPEGQDYVDIELSNMRKTIAKRLTESKTTIPHAYSTIQCNMGEVMKLRTEFSEMGVKVSPNDFIIKAAAVALERVPKVNATWAGTSTRLQSDIDICVAVATESGLITPIVKDAVSLGLDEISTTVRELAGKARDGKLQPHEFMGGTFTISNLGMFGISEFSAIINPPQACILAVGSSRLVLGTDGNPCNVMTVTLCSDARVVDDFLAVEFLEAFKEVLETPMLMVGRKPPRVSEQETIEVDIKNLFAK